MKECASCMEEYKEKWIRNDIDYEGVCLYCIADYHSEEYKSIKEDIKRLEKEENENEND